MKTFTCKRCGKQFKDYPSNNRKFCSKKCYQSGKTTYTKKCIICKKEFSYQRYKSNEQHKPRMCCSTKCQYVLISRKNSGNFVPNKYNQKDESKWRVYICKHCGREFEGLINTPRVFCSIKCKGEWQKMYLRGENNPYWKPLDQKKPYSHINHKARKEIIAKREKCEHCGSKEFLQVHHKDRNRKNNSPENLLLLCKLCHAKLHKEEGNPEIYNLIMSNPTQQ